MFKSSSMYEINLLQFLNSVNFFPLIFPKINCDYDLDLKFFLKYVLIFNFDF